MKELEIELRKNGFLYRQVFKNENGYVYEQILNGKPIAYEAFFRKENTQFNCVSFPGNEAFGTWAWSCRTIEKAIERLK
jgi:hypothetical protein